VSIVKRRRLLLAAAALALPALVLAIYWFEPYTLFIDRHARDRAPHASTQLASGTFRSLEHETQGRASLLRRPDGRHVLRLDDLRTSNGPQLHVYLSSVTAQDDWFVYDDAEYVDLGPLAGNLGSSNYEIPAGIDPGRFSSAVVWCKRFSVGFGVAPLKP
jgi:hypothetical protein